MTEPAYAAIALALAGAEGGAPTEILLLPAGEVRTRPNDGRPSWHNTDPAAVVTASAQLAQDLPIDFEHQTQRAKDNGQPAPASGWIKRVFERDGAVWGAVEWTAEAARMVAAKQYRFISPVFSYDPSSRKVQRILGAALVNEPALYMPALARAGDNGGTMDFLEKIRAAFGLGPAATEDEMIAAATAVRETRDAMRATAAVEKYEAQGRISPATREPMLALARRDPDGFEAFAAGMPVSDENGETRAQAAVDRCTTQGRVPPAARGQALALARRDPDGFEAFVSALPALTAGPLVPPGAPTHRAGAGALDATETAAARALGLTAEQYQESRQALAQARAEGEL